METGSTSALTRPSIGVRNPFAEINPLDSVEFGERVRNSKAYTDRLVTGQLVIKPNASGEDETSDIRCKPGSQHQPVTLDPNGQRGVGTQVAATSRKQVPPDLEIPGSPESS